MIEESLERLRRYCEREGFKGWDPYDGLNSAVFRATPLRRWDLARLALIQFCKRSPVNFRVLLRIPKQFNAKGIGLFLSGYCNLYWLSVSGQARFGTPEELRCQVEALADILLELQSPGYSGACWGYNFDWQARRLFLFPAGTPTVVATTFCADALFNAYEVTGERRYLDAAVSASEFVLKDLRRTSYKGGFLISYSPLPGNDTVFNASLLGAKLLSNCYRYTGNNECSSAARGIVAAVCQGQSSDGSWPYGLLPIQSWIDSFHTGYILESLATYMRLCDDDGPRVHLERGFKFYIGNFFLSDGTPKYYHNRAFPIDVHCPAQLPITLCALQMLREHMNLCRIVIEWAVCNMQDADGFFYYQIKRSVSSKISYMRWSNAFMFNALSKFLLEANGQQDSKWA